VAILEDRKGALWVGTEYGLIRLDGDRKQLIRYRNDPSDPDSLPADWVLALCEDSEDGIWGGHCQRGVARFSADPPLFAVTGALGGLRPFSERTTSSLHTRIATA